MLCVADSNSFSETEKTKTENDDGLSKTDSAIEPNADANAKQSKFSIEECLKYAELCKADGDAIQNTKALAIKLHKTGEADAFIFNTLFPKEAALAAAENFGEPVKFTDEPCRVCFGAKMANTDGKGARRCVHCKDERGKATGKEPEGENEQ